MLDLNYTDKFVTRHIGPNENEISEMLNVIGVENIEKLIDETIPESIRLKSELKICDSISEYEFINYLREKEKENKVAKSYIGLGYYPTITPAVIQRNIFENPGWYTQYTPYQAEISQGRLEALLNFQTMVSDLTGLPIANASLLDEGTSAAEAMLMFYHSNLNKKDSKTFVIDISTFPQTIDVLKTRASSQGIEIKIINIDEYDFSDNPFAIFVQFPNADGEIEDYSTLFQKAKEKGIYIICAADLLSLTLITPPGEIGADVVVGSTQRFGVPMGYGGPHAAYFSTKDEFKRLIPGRIIGISIDSQGNPALRMALQTREQHIKREKATSNICTSQVLLAIMSSMYSVYHGPIGLKKIAERIHLLTSLLNDGLINLNFKKINKYFFDTLNIEINDNNLLQKIKIIAQEKLINFKFVKNSIGISLNETTNENDVYEILKIFSDSLNKKFSDEDFQKLKNNITEKLPISLMRKSSYLTHPVFNSYHSETELMRYIKKLENKDLSLTRSMIPLGSCTMKLNAASEMLELTRPEFANIHPFAPNEQTIGYQKIINELELYLKKITGFDGVSLQPNSGAQGEFTGLMVIRQYFIDKNEKHRNVVLIPSSAHGTNPASAVMAGMQVVVVNCDDEGNIDLNDLKMKAEQNRENLAAIMITYPSTHGVFEESVKEICEIIHQNGGQVYLDGANMNAQVGLTTPKIIGADICHLNLHKTFAIPHGGGGPGVGPICAAKHLVPFLPKHSIKNVGGEKGITSVASAPYGSANILLISLGYIKMLGSEGLKKSSEIAILNANYIKSRLEKYYKVLYKGKKGRVGHELIFDFREFKRTANIEVDDIAKRLMDYSFHAPTVSFPVPGTLMVEPTESESKYELDRFCNAMISIREEISEIENGIADIMDNVLKNAPHTIELIASSEWNHSYSREKAIFPISELKKDKFFPSVGRINNAYGDRNLVCTCPPISEYMN
ncbi:MAG: aminomethyl-transferring glycine dehydrogenase [Ignavibacterium sp.]